MPTSATNVRTPEQDRDLFERVKRDPTAIGEVYDLYADRLYGFLMKRVGHKETAEDLVSKTFTKLLENHSTLEWQGISLGAWLFRVASNSLVDHWRSASVRLDQEIDTDVWNPPGNDDPAWNAEIKLDSEQIKDVMRGLSPRDQEVLNLKFFGEYETAEIAAALNVSANHAAVLLYRAIGRLREKSLKLNPKT